MGSEILAFIIFLVSTMILFCYDRTSALEAAGFNAYLFVVYFFVCQFVEDKPKPDVLRFHAPNTRAKVILSVVAVIFAIGVWGVVVNFDSPIPGLSLFWHALRTRPISGGTAVPNLLFFVLVPIIILAALRFSPSEVGLHTWARNSWKPLCIALLLPVSLIISALIRGKTGPIGLGFTIVRDAASAGFSEEFLFRGLLLAAARTAVTAQVALALQATAWALLHLWSSLDEPGPIALVAYLIATSGVPGFLLGAIAIRTRSLAFTSLIHTSLDVVRHLS